MAALRLSSIFHVAAVCKKIAHSGDWIVLEDAWTGPVDSSDTLFGKSTYTPRLFISKIGSDSWDTIKPPTKENIKTLYADSQGIYVGMYASAEVFEYSPSKKSWKQFKLKDSLQAGEWYSVYGIGRFQNRLIVSIAGYQRIASDANGKVASFVKWKNASGWEDVDASPRPYSSTAKDDFSTEPFHFHKGFEWKGKFYAATIDGVWRLDATGSTWTKLPDVPKLLPFTRDYATNPTGDFVLHKNRLYVTSVLDETLFSLNENESSWLQVDSLFHWSLRENICLLPGTIRQSRMSIWGITESLTATFPRAGGKSAAGAKILIA